MASSHLPIAKQPKSLWKLGGLTVSQLGATFSMKSLRIMSSGWKAIQWPTDLLFAAIACSLIYHFGPNLKRRRSWQLLTPGMMFGALGWLAASFGFRMYLHFFNHYSATYGSLGAVMVLMIWLYVSGLAYLIGEEINAVIERAAFASIGT